MQQTQDIPSHSYNETVDKIQRVHGKDLLLPESQLPFAITRFEEMNEVGQANYPHRHDCYEILYVAAGAGTHVIDFEPYPIQPPGFYFLSKDQIHFWQLTQPLQGYALLFPEEFLGVPSSAIVRGHDFTFFHQVGAAPYLAVDPEHMVMLNGLLQGIEAEYYNETECSLSVLRAYLHILLTQLHRLYVVEHPDEHSATTSSLVRKFEQLVAEHFLTDHGVDDYAGRIGVSASHLRDTVKAVSGYTPGQIIRQKLVLEAKRLLAHGNVTVAEIGYRLNFEDSSYFGRFFKRETGLSPVAFRKQIRQQYLIAPK